MLCGACGYENQTGNRFCGMCGTPLPHRPLGSQGTHSFTRVPLESTKTPDPAATPADNASSPPAAGRTGVLVAMPRAASLSSGTVKSERPAADMVPEIPLDEFVKGFRYVPPADPQEITMRGDAEASRPEPAVAVDAAATVPTEIPTASTNSTSSAEDIGQRLGLEDSPAGEERRDRPRFLDFSEPALPPKESGTRESIVAGPSFLGLDEVPRDAGGAVGETEDSKPSRRRGLTWFAVAALLVFAVLGVLEWRSQVNQTNDGPVEVVKVKLRDMMSGHNSPPQSTGSADANVGKPAMQVEEQPKSPPADQNVPANLSAPAASNSSADSNVNAGDVAASPAQNTTPQGEVEAGEKSQRRCPTPR